MGSGAVLGLAPAPEYTFLIYVSPVGNYFKVFSLNPCHFNLYLLMLLLYLLFLVLASANFCISLSEVQRVDY